MVQILVFHNYILIILYQPKNVISFDNWITWQLNYLILSIFYEILFYYWLGENWMSHNFKIYICDNVFDHHNVFAPGYYKLFYPRLYYLHINFAYSTLGFSISFYVILFWVIFNYSTLDYFQVFYLNLFFVILGYQTLSYYSLF